MEPVSMRNDCTDEKFERRFGSVHNRNQPHPHPRGEQPAPQLYAQRYEGEYLMDLGPGGYGYEQVRGMVVVVRVRKACGSGVWTWWVRG